MSLRRRLKLQKVEEGGGKDRIRGLQFNSTVASPPYAAQFLTVRITLRSLFT
jgi:hypothetical protein